MEQSNSDSFKAEIDESELAMASMREYVFLATFTSHLIDSCCLEIACFSSRRCAFSSWQQLLSVPHTSGDATFGNDDNELGDTVGMRGGSVVEKLVFNWPPF